MTCVEGLLPWLSEVAFRFCSPRPGLEKGDLIQEGVLAILRTGTTDEALAKVVAVRAMTKFRRRWGGRRGNRVVTAVGHRLERTHDRAYEADRGGVFWENLSPHLSPAQFRTLRLWAEGGHSAAEIGELEGVGEGAVNGRLRGAFRTLRERWNDQGL